MKNTRSETLPIERGIQLTLTFISCDHELSICLLDFEGGEDGVEDADEFVSYPGSNRVDGWLDVYLSG